MEGIGSGFGYDVDQASRVIPVLSVDVVGQDTELGDRIEIRNNRGPVVHMLFDIAAIYHKPVGRFLLSAHRKVSRSRSPEALKDLYSPDMTGATPG